MATVLVYRVKNWKFNFAEVLRSTAVFLQLQSLLLCSQSVIDCNTRMIQFHTIQQRYANYICYVIATDTEQPGIAQPI